MNELAKCMQIDVTVTTMISDDYCCIGISITFQMSLYLYRNVDSYAPIKHKEEFYIRDLDSAIQYLQGKQPEIKQCYSDWNDIMLEYQKEADKKVYKSLDEIQPILVEAVEKQVGIRGRIEDVILEADKLMERYYQRGADKKAATSYLLFLDRKSVV